MYQQNTVEVEDHVWETLELQEQEVTPDFINRSLYVQIKLSNMHKQIVSFRYEKHFYNKM